MTLPTTGNGPPTEVGAWPGLTLGVAVEWAIRRTHNIARAGYGVLMNSEKPAAQLIEFPADDPDRARAFWSGLLERPLEQRDSERGTGWETTSGAGQATVGVHARGRGPGDTASLAYFDVRDLPEALERVRRGGGSVVHPGSQWAVCRDSEGNPFGLHQTS